MRKTAWIVALLLALGSTPAAAAKIIYTITGTISENGIGFKFVGVGDTNVSYQTMASNRIVPLSSLVYTDTNGGKMDFEDSGSFGSDEVLGVASFYTQIGGPNATGTAIALKTPELFGYDGLSTRFLVAGQPANLTSGDLQFDADDLTFEAIAVPTSPVPEPATWALMISGFGLAGTMARRRHSDLQTKPASD